VKRIFNTKGTNDAKGREKIFTTKTRRHEEEKRFEMVKDKEKSGRLVFFS